MNRLLTIIAWTLILTLFLIHFLTAAGCSTLEGSYSTIPHDAAWRARQDQEDPVMQFLGHIAEGSFGYNEDLRSSSGEQRHAE